MAERVAARKVQGKSHEQRQTRELELRRSVSKPRPWPTNRNVTFLNPSVFGCRRSPFLSRFLRGGPITFYFEKIWSPSLAPINLTTEVTVKEAGFGASGDKNQFEAIELAITANNPSTRNVYLLPNYWRAMGVPIETRSGSYEWVDNANTLIEQETQPPDAGTHYLVKKDSAGRGRQRLQRCGFAPK